MSGGAVRARDCDCVLLAAGLSSRMRGSKMLREIEGRPLVRVALENALAACRRAIVVVGHDADAVRRAAGDEVENHGNDAPHDATESPPARRIVFVENPNYRDGMFGSIQAGMREVASEWFFIVPGDMPGIDAGLFEAVARGACRKADGPGQPREPLAVVPYYRETRGHPVLVHRSLIPRLLAEPRTAGPMRDLLARYPVATIHLERSEITLDLDTDHDVARFAGGPEGRDTAANAPATDGPDTPAAEPYSSPGE